MEELMVQGYAFAVRYGVNILLALLILFIGKWVVRFVTNACEKMMLKSKMEKTLASFLKNVIYTLIMAFVVIAALNQLGIQTMSLVALLGAAGLAVGLALQGSLSNFAAGVILIMLKPFKVGDFIEAGGTIGSVEEIQIFNTILNHPDNRRQCIPNSKITGDTITNFTAIDKRRIDLVFSISYGDDMKKAKEVLARVVASDSRILAEPKPVIAVSALGDSGVNIVVRPFVRPSDYWAVYFNLVETGKEELEKNGITIPFPQRDIHIYQETTASGVPGADRRHQRT